MLNAQNKELDLVELKIEKDMLFGNKIKQLRDENEVLQRQLAAWR